MRWHLLAAPSCASVNLLPLATPLQGVPPNPSAAFGPTIMRLRDPASGKSWFSKRRKRYDDNRDARELTFSCYRRLRFLERKRTRQWFIAALQTARQRWPVDVWAYVI